MSNFLRGRSLIYLAVFHVVQFENAFENELDIIYVQSGLEICDFHTFKLAKKREK